MRRRLPLVTLAALSAVLAACTTRAAGSVGAGLRSTSSAAMAANATVTSITDGDTIDVDVGGHHEAVRLLGVDTPEVKDPRKPVECFGHEASAFTASLLPKGTPVRLERDVEPRDKYGRLLAYVYRASDGLFVELELARRGYADALVIPPNIAHADQLRAAVAAAKSAGTGLWGACGAFGVPA
jgi:micrococcal nuclease